MISLVVVNFHSAALASAAIRSARASSSEPLRVVIVDNSRDSHEAAALSALADELIVSATNRGYAGAINDARGRCEGSVMIVANPDVVFAPEAIDRLVEPLAGDVAVTGPALFWDEELTWLLPPSELHTASEKLSEAAGSRWPSFRARRDGRRIAHRLAFWRLTEPTSVRSLSGAVMAIRLDDFDRVGGFDERFRLYFEENDFLRRLGDAKRRILYVPAARCRHLYNQSAGQDAAEAAAFYADSEMAYLTKWAGPLRASLLKSLERAVPPKPMEAVHGPIELERPGLLLEASPLASFETAAGHFATGRTADVPPDILAAYQGEVVYLRVIDPAGARVLAAYARQRR